MSEGALSARISDAPGDPIFGIVELFRADARPHKINLAAGVYMDEQGVTPILPSVRAAEERLLASTTSKLYMPIGGDPAYLAAAKSLLFRTVGGAWGEIAQQIAHRGILPILDFAYQGFGEGLVEDAASLRAFLATGCEVLVASSSSKNFALYNERVGSLAIIGADGAAAASIASHARMAVRTMWSNPPAHGGAIVSTILGDASLRAQWEGEVSAMRTRITESRTTFAAALTATGAGDFSYLLKHHGMFSLLDLTDDQLKRLRDEHAVYLVARGRINMAGLSAAKIPIVAKAVASVLA